MKVRLSLTGVVAVAMALALFGVLNGVDRSQALMPQPIQPFGPADVGGLSSTQLGAAIINHSDAEIIKGERSALPWNFTPPGFGLMVDKEIADGTPVGTVQADIDALCDGAVDILASSCSPLTPYLWVERTTAVEGTSEAYVKAMMPPFSFLLRHRADGTNICLGGAGGIGLPIDEVLNTVYTNVPWSPNSASFAATSKLGGRPAFPNPGGAVCLDSPQSSTSEDGKVSPGAVGAPEAGPQCANTADDDADTVVNDGCPAVYFYKGPTCAPTPPSTASGLRTRSPLPLWGAGGRARDQGHGEQRAYARQLHGALGDGGQPSRRAARSVPTRSTTTATRGERRLPTGRSTLRRGSVRECHQRRPSGRPLVNDGCPATANIRCCLDGVRHVGS